MQCNGLVGFFEFPFMKKGDCDKNQSMGNFFHAITSFCDIRSHKKNCVISFVVLSLSLLVNFSLTNDHFHESFTLYCFVNGNFYNNTALQFINYNGSTPRFSMIIKWHCKNACYKSKVVKGCYSLAFVIQMCFYFLVEKLKFFNFTTNELLLKIEQHNVHAVSTLFCSQKWHCFSVHK